MLKILPELVTGTGRLVPIENTNIADGLQTRDYIRPDHIPEYSSENKVLEPLAES